MSVLHRQETRTPLSSRGKGNSPRERSGTISVSNPNTKTCLLTGYRDSEFSTLTAMVADHKDKIPRWTVEAPFVQ